MKRNSAAQTALMMAVLILISKGLGFIREMALAYFFGTSYITDAYVLATSIPTTIFGGVLGAVSTAYMPLLAEKVENEGKNSANVFTSQALSILFVIAAISSLLGLLFSDQITAVFASGFSGEAAKLTSYFLRITFSYVLFTSTSGIMESYLQYKGVFLPQIAAGYLLNAGAVVIIAVSAVFGYQYLAWGLFIGHMAKFIVTYLITRGHGFRYKPDFHLNEAVKRIAVLTLPVFVGNYFIQINNFVDKTLSTSLPEGSASALNYSSLLVGLVTGLTATVLTTILYPKLTQASTLDNHQRFQNVFSAGINLICIITVPCALGAMAFSSQAVQIVYERGMFDAAATRLTATAFFYYSAGLVFTSLSLYLTQTFYSRQSMRLPMISNGLCVVINIGLSLFLVRLMGHGGLALASSIAAVFNSLFLYLGLRWKFPEIVSKGKALQLSKIIFSAAFSVGLSRLFYGVVLTERVSSSLLQLVVAVCLAGLLYLSALYVLKVEEVKFFKQLFHQ